MGFGGTIEDDIEIELPGEAEGSQNVDHALGVDQQALFTGQRARQGFEVKVAGGLFVCFSGGTLVGVFLCFDQIGAQHGQGFGTGAGSFAFGGVVAGNAGLAEGDGDHFLRGDDILVPETKARGA